jgi:hypothetical protein
MWSLPDITSLNARAAANVPALKREAQRKRKPKCEVYGCDYRAVESVEWFDIFSDDPKGLIHVCSNHSGDDLEGYFRCDACQRVLAENYTWEIYKVSFDEHTLCLKCAAEEYFSGDENWIDPKKVKAVALIPRATELFNSKTGVLNVALCRHVLGVKQPLPAGIEFVENSEFDSYSGRQISGRNLLNVIHDLNQPFCPVLDAGYQFAVSIGIYVREQHLPELPQAA